MAVGPFLNVSILLDSAGVKTLQITWTGPSTVTLTTNQVRDLSRVLEGAARASEGALPGVPYP